MRWLEAMSLSRTIDMTLRYSKVDSCGSDFINCSTRRLCNERVVTLVLAKTVADRGAPVSSPDSPIEMTACCSSRPRPPALQATDLDRGRQDDKHTVALGVGLAELFARLEAPRRADLHHSPDLRWRAIFEERKLLKDCER